MLEAFGHEVIPYRVHNDSIKFMSSLNVAARTIWNRASYREVRQLIRVQRPDIVHFNNTFPLISPSAYYAAQAEGVPVIQTLRNYRLLCPSAFFLRDQRVCELCLGRTVAWPSVVHRCYRQSRSATAVVAAMLTTHKLLRTWQNAVDVYIALTEFGRDTFVRGGLPKEKLVVKPNFVYPDPGPGDGHGGYAIFVGRLSEEKGIHTLLDAWRLLDAEVPLKIVGGGPLQSLVQEAVERDARITWLGQQPPDEVAKLVGDASYLVFPSLWYEGMPRTIIEAYAKGTPVIGSNLGAMQDMIVPNRTGFHFEPGQPSALAAILANAWSDQHRLHALRQSSRLEYERLYSYQANYDSLMTIYGNALRSKRGDAPVP